MRMEHAGNWFLLAAEDLANEQQMKQGEATWSRNEQTHNQICTMCIMGRVASELYVHVHNRMVRSWALCSLTHFHERYSATLTPER